MLYTRISNVLHALAVPGAILILGSVLAVVLSQQAFGYGYGYGYGTDTCLANAPTGLSARTARGPLQEILSWDAVQFTNCDTAKPQYYEVQILDLAGQVVISYTNIKITTWPVSSKVLKTNTSYQFRVRAVATDNTTTIWSGLFLFHTN